MQHEKFLFKFNWMEHLFKQKTTEADAYRKATTAKLYKQRATNCEKLWVCFAGVWNALNCWISQKGCSR